MKHRILAFGSDAFSRVPVVLMMTGVVSLTIGQRSPNLNESVRQLRESGKESRLPC